MCFHSRPDSIGFLLAWTCKRYRFWIHAQLAAIGLHRGQQFVLRSLWVQEGLTHSELAEQLHIQPATISNALKRMEKAGFVERRPDAKDQRVSRVYLTDAGRNIREAVEEAWNALEEQAFAGFSPAERDQLRGFILRVLENLDRESTTG